jgi:hypothetical protein
MAGSGAIYREGGYDDDGIEQPFVYVSGFDSQANPYVKKKNTRVAAQSSPNFGAVPYPYTSIVVDTTPFLPTDGSQTWGLLNDYRVIEGVAYYPNLMVVTSRPFPSTFTTNKRVDTRPLRTDVYAAAFYFAGVSNNTSGPRFTSFGLEWEAPYAPRQKERISG